MSSNHRPWPEIARFPGEPKLQGPPHKAKESIFAQPGVADAANLVGSTLNLSAKARERVLKETLESMSPGNGEILSYGIETYSDPAINHGRRLITQAKFLLEKVKEGESKDGKSQKLSVFTERTQSIFKEINNEAMLEVIQDIAEHQSLPKNKRANLLAKKSGLLINNPRALKRTALLLEILGNDDGIFDQQTIEQIDSYKAEVYDAVYDAAGARYTPIPDEEDLYSWLDFASMTETSRFAKSHPEAREFLNKIGRRRIGEIATRFNDANSTIDMVYKITKAGFTSGNIDVVRFTLDLLYGQTEIMPFGSDQFFDVWFGAGVATGESRKKARELTRARAVMASMFYPGVLIKSRQNLILARQKDIFETHILKRKAEKIAIVGTSEFNADIAELQDDLFGIGARLRHVAPIKLGQKRDLGGRDGISGPLIEHVDMLTGLRSSSRFKNGKREAYVCLPNVKKMVKGTTKEINELIKDGLDNSEKLELTELKHFATLAQLLPEGITRKQLLAIVEATDDKKLRIKHEQLHTLSPRGDTIEFTDPVLTKLGLKNVTYRMDPDDKSQVLFIISVGNSQFTGRLSQAHELQHKNGWNMPLPEAGAFIEHVIVSHLAEILCTDNVGDFDENGNMTEQRKAFSSRRAHRRILPEGKRPTPEQVIKILDVYGIDLTEKNYLRRLNGDDGYITWVREVDNIALSGNGAVTSRAQFALNELNKILNHSN